jgi:RHS repeat-associated protein
MARFRFTTTFVVARFSHRDGSTSTRITIMRRFTSSWSTALRKLGFRATSKWGKHSTRRGVRFSRRPQLETLEERINFSTGISWVSQTPPAHCPCGHGKSPADLTAGNGAITGGGPLTHNSSSDPVVSLQFRLIDEAEDLNDADYLREDVTIGNGSPVSYYWGGGGGVSEPYGASGEYAALESIQIDPSNLATGVYNWSIDTFSSEDPETPLPSSYSADETSANYFVHVVNRTDSPFGDGWSLPGLDQLAIQDALPGQPDGVSLLTSNDALVWFGDPTYDEAGNTNYTREDNPYNFSILQRLSSSDDYTLTDPDGTVHNFHGSYGTGYLTSVVDRNGNVLDSYTYDSSNRVHLITDESGQTTKFDYNSNGLISAITDFCTSTGSTTSGSQTTNYEYTLFSGAVTQMRMTEPDPDGSSGPLSRPVTTYNYNTANQLVSVIDARGLETDVEYDNVGLVSQIKQRDGGLVNITSAESQAVGSATDDDMPVLTPYRAAISGLTTIGDTTDPAGYEIQDVYGHMTYVVRGKFGNILAEKDPEGNVTQYEYDVNGLPIQVVQPDPDGAGPLAPSGTLSTYYGYDSLNRGLVAYITHPDDTTEHWEYGAFGQVSSYTDANGHVTTYDVDSGTGNVNSMTQNDGSIDLITYYTYTDGSGTASIGSVATTTLVGLVETVTYPNNNKTLYTYYDNGLVEDIISAVDTADETTTHYDYDERDRVFATEVGSSDRHTEYHYDNLDRLTERIDPDADGTETGHPLVSPVWKYFYDAAGNQTSVTDPNEKVTRYVYDVRDRPFQVIAPVEDPSVTPAVQTKDDSEGTFLTSSNTTSSNWSQITRSGALNSDVWATSATGEKAVYSFTTGLDSAKKYAAQVRWVPSSSTTYDKDAEWSVYCGSTVSGDALTTMKVDLNRPAEGLPDSSGMMWLTLGAFSPVSGAITVKLEDTNNNGHLVIDAVRLVEVGPVTETDYDEHDNLVKSIDPLNHVTTYHYDNLDRLTTRTDPDPDGASGTTYTSPITHYTYNPEGWLRSVTNPEGDATFYEYDALGRQTKEIGVGVEGLTAEYRDASGALLHRRIDENVDFSAPTDFAGYDDLGDGFRVSWTGEIYIGTAGNVTFSLDTTDESALYIDDQLIVNDSNPSDVASLTAGWHKLEVTFHDLSDAGDNGLVVSYDVGGTGAIPTGVLGTSVTATSYDDVGNRTSLTDPNGNTTTWGYDDVNRVTSESIDTGTSGTRSYEYNDADNIVTKTDRDSRVTTYQYDHLDRLKDETWYDYSSGPAMRTISYAYDLAGNLTSVSDPDATYDYDYDFLDRQTGATETITGLDDTIHFDHGYDVASRMTSSAATIGDTADYKNSYLYDTLGRMTRVTQQGQSGGYDVSAKRVDFAYNAASQFSTLTRYASTNTASPVATSTYGYDQDNRLTSIAHAGTASGSTFAETHGYQYDAASRLIHYTTVQDDIDATYTYDHRGQLTDADGMGGTYGYDAAGNRTEDASNAYTIDAHNRVVNDGTNTYEYDSEGNLTAVDKADGTFIWYAWDNRNRLTSVTYADTDGNPVTGVNYTYDAFNQLIGREIWGETEMLGGATEGGGGMEMAAAGGILPDAVDPADVKDIYVYDNGQVVLQFEQSYSFDGLTHRYLWGPNVDQLLADENVVDLFDAASNETLWALTDKQGSICDEVDSNGALALHQAFDAFGNGNGQSGLTFGYTGRLYDSATGLQNNLNRWYSSTLGRWMSEDPIGFAAGDANLYRYVGNSATNYTDPIGLGPWGSAIGAGIGGTIGLVGGVVLGGGGSALATGGVAAPAGAIYCGGAGMAGGAGIGAAWGDWLTGGGVIVPAPPVASTQPMPGGDNRAQNRKFKQICDEANLNKDEREQLHREISKDNYTEEEIRHIRDDLFPKKAPNRN